MGGPHKPCYRNGSGNGRQWRSDEDAAVAKWAAALQRMPAVCTAALVAMICTAGVILLVHPGVRHQANETAKAVLACGGDVVHPRSGDVVHPRSGGMVQASSGKVVQASSPEVVQASSPEVVQASNDKTAVSSKKTEQQASSDKSGFCRLEYTVKTWDGKDARVCDPSLCVGHEKLKKLKAAGTSRRWTAFHESAYMKLFNANKIMGWLKPRQIAFVKAFSAKQHALGIYGAVGEIGVHHGKFLIPIVGNAMAEEPAIAIDLFEDQRGNVDTSGRGSKAHLLANLEASGIPENSLLLMAGNSLALSVRNFTAKGFPSFRLLSVDGGHTLEITLHDMMVASCLVAEGGIVVLDDFPNPTWMGVAEALVHFVHAQDRLVPFLHGANKVWFTTPSHVRVYQDFMKTDANVFPCTKDHVSKQTLAGHKLCWTGYN